MISNKTAAAIFLIILNMQLAATTSSGDGQVSSSSSKSALQVRKRVFAPRPKGDVLKDKDNAVNPVEVQKSSTEGIDILQRQLVPKVNKFEELIIQERYDEIIGFGEEMSNGEFLMQICPVVKTLDQYNGIVGYLKRHNLVASFYTQGNIEVVKRVIVESKVYVDVDYAYRGDLERALPLAVKNGNYGRIISLLDIRKEITVERDEQLKRKGERTSFEKFMHWFLHHLAPWKDGIAFKKFLNLRGSELRRTHHEILDTLCEELVFCLRFELDKPSAENLLYDLMEQPSVLTLTSFVRGFLKFTYDDKPHSLLIKYAWREVIEKCLKREYLFKIETLWNVMKREHPNHFSGPFPSTPDALNEVLKGFLTKQQVEEEWTRKNIIFTFSSDINESSSFVKPSPQVKEQMHTPRTKNGVILENTTYTTVDGAKIYKQEFEIIFPQEQSVPPANKKFERLIKRGNYAKIFELGKGMKLEEFMEQLCSVIKTIKQYNRIAKHLKSHNLVPTFYMYGDIGVVKDIIFKSGVYSYSNYYVRDGDLETALHLILENYHQDRAIELFNIRKDLTTKEDRQHKLDGERTGFEMFVMTFLDVLASWNDGKILKRFLTLNRKELREQNPDILDTLCYELLTRLRGCPAHPRIVDLLNDLIGQPYLLTSATFTKAFLDSASDKHRSSFIKHAWREAIREGLKMEHQDTNKELWRVMKEMYPDRFFEAFPSSKEALGTVLKHFPKKQQLEKKRVDKNTKMRTELLKSIESFPAFPGPRNSRLMFIIGAMDWY